MKSRKAWVFERSGNWYCGWYEPDGKRRKKSFGKTKTKANQFATKKSAELIDGVSDGYCPQTWQAFIDDYETQKLALKRPATQVVYRTALEHFSRLCKPERTTDLTTKAIDLYIAKRSKEKGKTGGVVSACTINKELRALRAAANVAKDWKQLREAPKFNWVDESENEPTFISSDDFEAMYAACDAATRPVLPNIETADWWRSILLFAYLTGWRVGEILRLQRTDLDLAEGIAITRAKDNKGKKTVKVPLHSLIVDHLEQIKDFGPSVFPWPHEDTAIYDQLHAIQDKAGITKQCTKDHTCSDACRYYGFHDLRRGFATNNAGSLSAAELQNLMRHQDYNTTRKYIAMASQSRDAVVSKLAVPVLRAGS
jgi:integrase